MKLCPAFVCVWCACVASAADPAKIGSPQLDVPDANVIRVEVGNPPQVDLFVVEPPSDSRQTWSGPFGKQEPGRRTVEGVSHANAVAGTYHYRCVVQVPLPEFDDIEILDITIIATGHGPRPPPGPDPEPDPTPPPPTGLAKLTADACRAVIKPEDIPTFGIVGGIYVQVADEIKAGKYADIDSVARRLAELREAASRLPILWSADSYRKWEAISKGAIGPELDRRAEMGGLSSPAEYEQPFRDIAIGITDSIAFGLN